WLQPKELVEVAMAYNKAWEAQDYEAMRKYESWKGGEALEGFFYLQEFDPKFGMISPKVTKVEEKEDGEYLVLVLIKHNPPPQFIQHLQDKNMKVRSTLRQIWEKQEDGSFKHLFHVEKQRMMDLMQQPGMRPPKPPTEVRPPADKGQPS
ncbi:MAG: hypothetical protein AAF512_01515, partial [Pseudomonadota bacterium]